MKYTISYAAALVAAFSALGHAANDIPKCGDGSQCPDYAPCCSQYGQCGVGAYCLGGCDPKHSFDLKSCLAAPTCKSDAFTLDPSLSAPGARSQSRYLGNGSETNWVTSGEPRTYNDGVLLTMAPSTVGTLLMSAHYVWYGKIKATMKTSAGKGVITAFILMSDMKDEIDFEWVGNDLSTTQTNYYFQGITNYNNGDKTGDLSDTRQNWHTYEIDWQPDYINWSIDDKVVRTLKRDSTYNDTTKQYDYPQTPSRVQLSLWPGGLPSNGEGTIEWAGGLVNWDDSDAMSNGYYYAMVKDLSVECYDPPHGDDSGNNKAYYYTSTAGTEDTVQIGTNNTVIGSMQATGDDPSKGAPSPSSDSKSSSTSSTKSSTSTATFVPESVPGMSGGGNAGNSGGSSSGTTSGGDSGTNSNGDTSGSSYDSPGQNSGPVSFDQGMGSGSGSGGSGGTSQANHVVAGSAVALLGFFIAALML